MATREEILSLYKERRKAGILDLDATFTGQIENQIRAIAKSIEENGTRYSVVSAIDSSRNLFTQEEYWKLYPKKGKVAGEEITYAELEEKSIKKFREKYFKDNDDYGFVFINAILAVDNSGGEKEAKVQTRLRHEVYYNAGESQTFSFDRTHTTGNENIEIIVPGGGQTGFQLLKSYLSSYAYSAKFRQKIDDFQIPLQEVRDGIASTPNSQDLALVKSIGVLIMTDIGIPDASDYDEFNIFFPRPAGLESQNKTQTTGETGTSGTSGTSGTLGTGGVVPSSDTTGLGGEQEGGKNTVGVSGDSTNSNAKYTSVESVKDDDVNVQSTDQGEDPINLGIDYELSDSIYLTSDGVVVNQGLTGKPGSRGAVQQQQQSAQEARDTQPSSSPQTTTQPQSPAETNSSTGTTATENNTNVVRNEQQDIKDAKIAEITNPDTNVPNEPTEKGTGAVQGGDINVPDGITAKREDAEKPAEKPVVNAVPPVPAIEFDEWRVKPENLDQNGIKYRGVGEGGSPRKGQSFKQNLDWGRDIEKVWAGVPFPPESPIDVGIALNLIDVGLYNKNLPYMYKEHAEQHLLVDSFAYGTTPPGYVGKTIGGRNPKEGVSGNWAYNPFWCGIWVNFITMKNKKYQTDDTDYDIAGCDRAFISHRNGGAVNSSYELHMYHANNFQERANHFQGIMNSIQNDSKGIEAYKKCQESTKIDPKKPDKKSCDYAAANWKKYLAASGSYVEATNDVKKQKGLASKYTPGAGETINTKGTVALFVPSIHYVPNGSLLEPGKKLFDVVKKWPGAIVASPSHTELALCFTGTGMITLGGNTGTPASKGEISDSNGDQAGFKTYGRFYSFGGSAGTIFVKRGTKNPYTVGGLGGKLKRTPIFNDYEKRLKEEQSQSDPKQRSLRSFAYDMLKDHMEPLK